MPIMPIKYFDASTDVKLGDRVQLRVLFRRRSGRVVYVPGISLMNPEFEYNGMRWVGIRLDDRSLVATPILTNTGNLKKKIVFLQRDDSPADVIGPSSREFKEHGEGWSV